VCIAIAMVKGTNTQIDAGRIYALNLHIANRRGESKRAYHSITKDFESELKHFNIEHTQHVILDKLT
jgi:hypothetical protein